MKNFVVTLILGAIIGFGCAKALDQSAIAETASTVSISAIAGPLSTGNNVAVQYLEVKDGVSKEDATKYIEELNSLLDKAMPDVNSYIAEVDRGERTGQFAWITVIESVEIRNSYWPGDGSGGTQKWRNVQELPEIKAMNDKWDNYFNGVYEADFVIK